MINNQFGTNNWSHENRLSIDYKPYWIYFLERNMPSKKFSVEIDEYGSFTNLIPLNIITVKQFNNISYVLLEFEHFITKKRLKGFFKLSLFMNYYPKMLIDYYESNLEDNY